MFKDFCPSSISAKGHDCKHLIIKLHGAERDSLWNLHNGGRKWLIHLTVALRKKNTKLRDIWGSRDFSALFCKISEKNWNSKELKYQFTNCALSIKNPPTTPEGQ